jgi:alkylation response protein AidB-like acyl-CoA dehydrogenase
LNAWITSRVLRRGGEHRGRLRRAAAVIAVPGDAAGIAVDVYDKLGHWGVMTPRVHLDEVRVPEQNLIGQPLRTRAP